MKHFRSINEAGPDALRRLLDISDHMAEVNRRPNPKVPALRGKTVAVAGATTGQYGALWAQQDLRRILGIAGARVIEGDLPVARAQSAFDESGRLVDAIVAERLRERLEALAEQSAPLLVAA